MQRRNPAQSRHPPPLSELYDADYFQSSGKGHYGDYINDSLGPSRLLADTLFEIFRPRTSLDMGCAVGHGVKRLRELGVEAYGYDVSEWAVQQASAPYINVFDFSKTAIPATYELIYCYDVIEHIPADRLRVAVNNLWSAAEKDIVIVPALYPEGTTSDPTELTHEIFHGYDWWLDFFTEECGCVFDEELSTRLAATEHSRAYGYDDRIFVFTKLSKERAGRDTGLRRGAAAAEAARWFGAAIAITPDHHPPMEGPQIKDGWWQSLARGFNGRRRKPSPIDLAARACDAQQWELAVRYYRDALDLEPHDAGIWVQFGRALQASGKVREAELAYRRAIELDAENAEAQAKLGDVLRLRQSNERRRP